MGESARELGQYRLLDVIGSGGMGEVWRAEHRTLERPVAIKLIRPERLAGRGRSAQEALARFEREAKATAALRSPHTVAVHDFGAAEDGSLYYVMELLEGYDLETLVRRFGPVPAGRAIRILRQVCHSLEDAHRAGLVHRDIKPPNILVCRYGQELDFVKVLDFGLVKPSGLALPGEARLTGEGFIPGTPEYLSPESARGDDEVDWRADIYSLGCVAHWMLAGRHVFEASSPIRMALHHVETAPAPFSADSGGAIPPPLERIVLDCLAKDPRHRPQTAGELSERLDALSLERLWTRRDAEAWWRDHQPSGPVESQPTLERTPKVVPPPSPWSTLRRMLGGQ
jgi:serine/threonine-protein kinase